MRQNHSYIALRELQEHKEQEQRNTGDNIRIDHRDIIEELHRLPLSSLEVEYADCRYRS